MVFYVNGVLTPVMVDDYVPVDAYNRTLGSTTKTNELWAILLEKAWAKLHGSYARTEAGLPAFASSHLMGTASYSLHHEDYKS